MRLPSGSTRGTRKQVSPLPGTCARTRKRSHIGAEQNHLCPVSRQLPSPASTARVVLARTSEPPCFSVIPIPASSPALVAAGRSPGSYAVAVSPGSYAAASAGSARSAGTTEYVIDTGQPCPDSTCDQTRKPAAREVCGIGSVAVHGVPASPCPTASVSSRCQDGWKSTSSRRWPYRSWVRSTGGEALASVAHRRAASVPASRPRATHGGGLGAEPADGVDEREVAGVDVVVDQRRRLVGHLVGRGHGHSVPQGSTATDENW